MLSSISRLGLQRKPVDISETVWRPRRHGCLHGMTGTFAIDRTTQLDHTSASQKIRPDQAGLSAETLGGPA
jgi:hypothetical protein